MQFTPPSRRRLAYLHVLSSADASMTSDGRFLAISNMLTGFELYAMQADTELEPLCSFQQEVADRPPIPVIFVHGDSALLGGTTNGQLNLWEIYSRRKQPLVLEGEPYPSSARVISEAATQVDSLCLPLRYDSEDILPLKDRLTHHCITGSLSSRLR